MLVHAIIICSFGMPIRIEPSLYSKVPRQAGRPGLVGRLTNYLLSFHLVSPPFPRSPKPQLL